MRKIENIEERERRKRESNRLSVAKYQEKFKRINCRLDPSMYDRIQKTGESANNFIVEAIKEKLERDGY